MEAGRQGAADALANYEEDELERQIEAGREGGRAEWEGLNEEEQERRIEEGRSWWTGITDEDQHGFSEARKKAWQLLSKTVQENIVENLGIHAEVARVIRTEEAEEKYETEGEAVIKLDGSVWECSGCNLECAKDVRLFSFPEVSDLKMMKWMIAHKLMLPEFHFTGCGGDRCVAVAEGNSCGLKCPDCGRISKGGKRGLFARSKLGFVKIMFVVFCISTGISFAYLKDHVGVALNKNTWTSFVKKIGLVAGEFMEGNRRDPDYKWSFTQFDETAFGRR